jgi:N-acetylmuramoyl-L-alanine amidase
LPSPASDPEPPPAPVANGTQAGKSRLDTGGGLASSGKQLAVLKEIHRSVLPDGVRVVVDLDGEIAYHQEEIESPRRVFFDLKNVKAAPGLQDVALKFDSDVVREVRLGRHPQNTTRLVVDLAGVSSYTVYPLYSPYRLVLDFRRAGATLPTTDMATVEKVVVPPPPVAPPPSVAVSRTAPPLGSLPQVKPAVPEPKTAAVQRPLPSTPAPNVLPPAVPAANSNGKFSLSRQLGLGVSRVVIDAGHGGHDPGAHGNGVEESELTLDVALRVQKLLEKQAGIEVVMTRDTDVFIPLEERTAIANRTDADLFLSIHANASRNPQARGIETYFLNFAMNPEAEAVAARENASSGITMHSLPDIVRTIALNNKINESRDFAETVQKSMVKRLGTRNKTLKDLGVKQAPFVVLIGAGMPSVLAEISFLTNKADGTLLKTNAYRQQIAQALFDAILDYQQGLKRLNAIAGKKATFD